MRRVVCFGEMLLRLSPPGNQRFAQARSFDAVYGGAEANVAVALSHMGIGSSFVTRVPNNPMGQAVINELRKFGVETGDIRQGGERLAIYFLEKGSSERSSLVVYDRAHSSFSGLIPEEFDWKSILKDALWFHFSGITPALGEGPAKAVLEACRMAKVMGIPVSCDVNYRRNLWSPETAGKVMSELLGNVDVCISNEEHAGLLFGIVPEPSEIWDGEPTAEGYGSIARRISERFGCRFTALTIKKSISATRNEISAMAHASGNLCSSRVHSIDIVDSIGGGDAFTAGLIYGLLMEYDLRKALEFGVSANSLKQSMEGDFSLASAGEIQALAEGDGTVRVRR